MQGAFKAAFDIGPRSITIDTKLNDFPAWDPLGHIALGSSLEPAFGLSFDVDVVMEKENVRPIIRIIEVRLEKKS